MGSHEAIQTRIEDVNRAHVAYEVERMVRMQATHTTATLTRRHTRHLVLADGFASGGGLS